jgi:hypothetical protein
MDELDGGSPWGPSLFYLALALGAVAGGLAFLLWWPGGPPRSHATAAPGAVVSPSQPSTIAGVEAASSAPVQVAAAPRAATATVKPNPMHPAAGASAPEPDPGSDPTTDLSAFVNPGEVPTMGEVIQRLHAAGIHEGLGAFSPPGTRPPIVGLAVPEDFVLPEGYVRHYQATDDGQRIEAILMFSPDIAFIDAQGRVPVPEDRVVTPALAPPGLPIRRIVIPAPKAEPGRPGR